MAGRMSLQTVMAAQAAIHGSNPCENGLPAWTAACAAVTVGVVGMVLVFEMGR